MTDASALKVALVIPVFNRRETTLQALRSLSRIDTRGLCVRTIVVDDGSTDRTSEAVREEFPCIELISGERGPAGALARDHPRYHGTQTGRR